MFAHFMLLIMGLTGNLETARKMHIPEKIMTALAYLLVYTCGIVYLMNHWDITSGKKGKFFTVLSEKDDYMTDATYFGVCYIILIPFVTSTYCAYVKIVDD